MVEPETNRNECIACIKDLIEPHMNSREDLPVHGVSAFFICKKQDEHTPYTFLGKEKEGMNKGLFALPGGSAAKRKDRQGADLHKMSETIYDEIVEEVGLALTKDVFQQSFRGVFWVKFHDAGVDMLKTSAVLVLALSGVLPEEWTKEYQARITSFQENGLLDKMEDRKSWWKYVEWSDAQEFAMNDSLTAREDVSSFVLENWQQALALYDSEGSPDVSSRACGRVAVRSTESGQIVVSLYESAY